ncbi:DUF3850 domain-containing protein [Dryocola sp. LX212]
MGTHVLKILPNHYMAVISGRKKAELRKNDRDYNEGDRLHFREWARGKYTGRELVVRVTHVLDCSCVIEGADQWVVLSIRMPNRSFYEIPDCLMNGFRG